VVNSRDWPSADASGTIVIVHGLGEHIGRYAHVAARLNANRWNVVGYDQRGQGRTSGRRGHIMHFEELVAELGEIVRLAQEKEPGLETTIYAHSTGAIIALHYLYANPSRVDRAVLSAPCLVLAYQAPGWKVGMGNALARVAPRISLNAGFDPGLVSRDARVVATNKEDKLVSQAISTRYYREMYQSAMPRALARLEELRVPFLVIQGGADGLVNPRVAAEFENRATITGRVIRYEGGYHELHNDTIREKVFDDVDEWLEDPRAARR